MLLVDRGRTSLAVQWLRLWLPLQRAQAPPFVRKLGSRMLHDQKKKRKAPAKKSSQFSFSDYFRFQMQRIWMCRGLLDFCSVCEMDGWWWFIFPPIIPLSPCPILQGSSALILSPELEREPQLSWASPKGFLLNSPHRCACLPGGRTTC